MTVSLADIEAVAGLVAEAAIVTPMEESRWLQAIVGGPVLLKCENLQRTGSFKIRGAYVRLSRLSEEERARGVVAASAGNHAQGVALAAQMLGIKATVFMPEGSADPEGQRHQGVRRRGPLLRRVPHPGPRRRPGVRRRDRCRPDPPLRPPRHRRRPGHGRRSRSSSRPPRPPRCWCRPEAAVCSRASRPRSRGCDPTCASWACRRRRLRPTPSRCAWASRWRSSR